MPLRHPPVRGGPDLPHVLQAGPARHQVARGRAPEVVEPAARVAATPQRGLEDRRDLVRVAGQTPAVASHRAGCVLLTVDLGEA
jgi:hypothetical protein